VATPISSTELRDTIVRAFDPVLVAAGFVRSQPLAWVRARTPEIRDVVEASSGRRGGRFIRWGASLDYVPHIVGDSVRLHSTDRTARIDLGYDPSNFRDEWDVAAQPWTVTPDLGFPTPAERAASIARAIPNTAYPWLDAIHDGASLLEAFEREAAREGGQFAFDSYVQHRLGYAFALAHEGQHTRALTELQRWAQHHRPVPAVTSELRKRLELLFEYG
jgi:hypothetical protein